MKRLSALMMVGLVLAMAGSAFAQSDWRWRVYFAVRAADVTPANKNTIAQTFANGGIEPLVNELTMFGHTAQLSLTGNLPAVVYAFASPIKPEMKDALKALLDVLANARYAVVGNTNTAQYADGELIATNIPGLVPSGQIITWKRVLQYLHDEFGLVEITQ